MDSVANGQPRQSLRCAHDDKRIARLDRRDSRKHSLGQIVMSVMRSTRALVLAALATASACARPVLYYPVPPGAPAQPAAQPVLAGTASSAATANKSPAGLADLDYLRARHIALPVAGADMSKVEDTFNDPRDGGDRVHRALDILAPRGTPILSADDGKILRMTTSTLGGITMYTVDPEARLVYYYAHMDHYNDAMSPGRTIVKGDTLG